MKDYGECTTRDAKLAAIFTATKPEQLDAMWAAWEPRGWSRDGSVYGMLLERKAELGVKLAPAEIRTVGEARRQRDEGAKLPPITGKQTR